MHIFNLLKNFCKYSFSPNELNNNVLAKNFINHFKIKFKNEKNKYILLNKIKIINNTKKKKKKLKQKLKQKLKIKIKKKIKKKKKKKTTETKTKAKTKATATAEAEAEAEAATGRKAAKKRVIYQI